MVKNLFLALMVCYLSCKFVLVGVSVKPLDMSMLKFTLLKNFLRSQEEIKENSGSELNSYQKYHIYGLQQSSRLVRAICKLSSSTDVGAWRLCTVVSVRCCPLQL